MDSDTSRLIVPTTVRGGTTALSNDFPDPPTVQPESDKAPQVAIVVDDLGWQKDMAPVYDDINQSLTMAILPSRPYSRELYERWKGKFEFIIHMPMEPEGYPRDDPGKAALMTSMTAGEIRDNLSNVLDRFPSVKGLNNHMGSAFTSNPSSMKSLMSVLKRRRMYYLDSRTSASSVAYSSGREVGVPVLTNDVFLDHVQRDYASIRKQFKKLVRIAREDGRAIGIGHFQSEATARVLKTLMPRYAKRGVEFVTLGQIVRGTARQ